MKLTKEELKKIESCVDNFNDLHSIISPESCRYADADILCLAVKCLTLCYLDGYVNWEEVQDV